MPHIPSAAGPPAGQPDTPAEQPAEPQSPPAAPADDLPALSVAAVSAGEGDRLLRFTVSLDIAVAEPLTVRYATQDGSATAGSDYQAARGTLTIRAGSRVPARSSRIDDHQDRYAARPVYAPVEGHHFMHR